MANYTTENLVPVLDPENGVPAIRIGDQVFVMQNGGGGGATDFYKCATVSGPYTETYYAVSGAGMAAANGNYTDTGTTSGGKPVYSFTNSGTTYYLFYDSGWEAWFIYNSTTFSDYAMDECYYYKSDYEESWTTGGGGSGDPPSVTLTTVTHDQPKTWTGHKAEFSSGYYAGFESAITSGLSWTDIKPQIPMIYDTTAAVKVSGLNFGDLIFYAPLDVAGYTYTGQLLTLDGTVTFSTVSGIQCADFSSGGYLTPAIDFSQFTSGFSVVALCNPSTGGGGNRSLICRRSATYSCQLFLGCTQTKLNFWAAANGSETASVSASVNIGGFVLISWVYNNGAIAIYLNDTAVASGSGIIGEPNSGDLRIGKAYYSSEDYRGNVADLRIYRKALSAAEIASLAAELTPSAQ